MDDVISYYEKECRRFGFSNEQSVSRFFRGSRLQMNQNAGKGWAEMLQIDSGLYVGLCDYCLKKSMQSVYYKLITPLQFNILLAGHFDLQLPGKPKQTIGPGDIWFGYSRHKQAIYSAYSQPDNENICGLSIGLPTRLIESWLGDSSAEINRGLEQLLAGKSYTKTSTCGTIFPLVRGLGQSTGLMRSARELLSTEHQTIFGKLHFESLALELLAQLLTLKTAQTPGPTKECQKSGPAIDMAVDILRKEWDSPPTISSLARRVGLNECYLKRGFRSRTGMSIGQYIRQLRMGSALELLETGRYSIMEIALAIGYTNPSHFSAAFKKFYGETPSRYFSGEYGFS